ncbi:NAD-dependent epimerase/dehydratase family protein [Amylibacter sp.]|nr:NAD-dependent epimerase/dehydratase family protein [Amylibacter sp.]
MKISVTGGSGFIGSHVVSLLRKMGHQVVVIDDFSSGLRQYISNLSDVEIIDANLQDLKLLKDATKDTDVIIHLAASGNVIESVQSPMMNFQANVVNTLNVLEACRVNSIKRLIFSSTGGALMGNAPLPVDETSVPDPISPYGASKLACENYIKVYSKCYGIEYAIFRFGNVIGPNCYHKKGVINKFFTACTSSGKIDIFEDPSRDFVSVMDLANAITVAVDNEECKNEIFHLASGNEILIRFIADLFKIRFNLDSSRIKVSGERVGEVKRNYSNINKACQKLGWNPDTNIERLVNDTINWLENFEDKRKNK